MTDKLHSYLVSYYWTSASRSGFGQHSIKSPDDSLWQEDKDVLDTIEIIKKNCKIPPDDVVIISVIKIN